MGRYLYYRGGQMNNGVYDQAPIYMRIYQRIVQSIREGKVPKGSKLESIRQAALRHGVSTTTIEHAYNQLLIEGYIRSVPKKGYFVEAAPAYAKKGYKISKGTAVRRRGAKNLAQTEDMFNPERFRKIMNEVMSDDPRIYEPPDPEGEWALKEAIVSHLRSARDVITRPENVLVASGIQQLIIQLGSMLEKNTVVAYLNPGFKRALDAFRILGFTLEGHDTIHDLLESRPDLIYVSPSNQYPSGKVMPINERLEIIRHANRHGVIILEDDYNHLFRYNAYQIATLHSLSEKRRVVYTGSFSRNTLVSLRMSYMVLPAPLLEKYDASLFSQTVSKIEQLTMARFIQEGHYKRHLKRLSGLSKRKNDTLKKALEPYDERCDLTIYGLESNMHFVVSFVHEKDKTSLIKTLQSMDYSYRTFEERPKDVLIPYSGIPTFQMEVVMRKLFGKLSSLRLG